MHKRPRCFVQGLLPLLIRVSYLTSRTGMLSFLWRNLKRVAVVSPRGDHRTELPRSDSSVKYPVVSKWMSFGVFCSKLYRLTRFDPLVRARFFSLRPIVVTKPLPSKHRAQLSLVIRCTFLTESHAPSWQSEWKILSVKMDLEKKVEGRRETVSKHCGNWKWYFWREGRLFEVAVWGYTRSAH